MLDMVVNPVVDMQTLRVLLGGWWSSRLMRSDFCVYRGCCLGPKQSIRLLNLRHLTFQHLDSLLRDLVFVTKNLALLFKFIYMFPIQFHHCPIKFQLFLWSSCCHNPFSTSALRWSKVVSCHSCNPQKSFHTSPKSSDSNNRGCESFFKLNNSISKKKITAS